MESTKIAYVLLMDLKQAYGLEEVLGDPNTQGTLYDQLEAQDFFVVPVTHIEVEVLGNHHNIIIRNEKIVKRLLGNTKIYAETLPTEIES